MHGGDAVIPTLDDLTDADLEREWLVPVARAVEFLAALAIVVEPACVLDRDGLPRLRLRSRSNHLVMGLEPG